MKIKRYEGRTEAEVVRRIKRELGSKASIVSVKNVRAQGLLGVFKKPRVEIMAAFEEQDDDVFSHERQEEGFKAKPPDKPKPQAKIQAKPNIAPGPAPNPSQAPVPKESAAELSDFKESFKDRVIEEQADKIQMLENSVNSAQEMLARLNSKLSAIRHTVGKTDRRYRNNICQVLFDSMLEQGVLTEIATNLLNDLDAEPDPELGIEVTDIVKMVYFKIIEIIGRPRTVLDENGETDNGPRVLVFLGPTGVGKTTTIAKLSAGFALSKGKTVSLVSADTYRIAAVEQLRTYADILDIPFYVAYSADDLKEHLEMTADKDAVLLDTAGRSHRHAEHMAELRELLAVCENSQKYLVLSLTTKFEDMQEIAAEYQNLTDFDLIFTKLDETKSMGSVLNLCYTTGRPVSYITFGQNVPNDIRILEPEEIAKAIICGV